MKKKVELNKIINGKYLLLYIMIFLVIIFSFASDKFLTMSNIDYLLMSQVPVGFIALGAMCIVIVDEFDLSLGYMIGFLMVLGAWMIKRGCNVWIIILTIIAVGATLGLINGILCVKFGLSSFIATLAVGILLSGLTLGISGGLVLSGNFPMLILNIGQLHVGKVALCVVMYIIFAGIMYYVLKYTRFGRNLYAVGGSKKVSYLAGIKTQTVTILAFTLAGAFTGVAAIVQLGQTGAAYPDFGPELLMPAYAIVFLSYTVFKPGTFNIPGAVLATVLFGIGNNALSILGTPFWVQTGYSGVLLLIAVTASLMLAKKKIHTQTDKRGD